MKEKINIAELLKDCPKGMELDCVMYEDCKFLDIDATNDSYLIRITTPCGVKYLDKYGRYTIDDKAKCVIFPKGKTTWEGFHRPFKDGDVVFYSNTIAIFKEWGDETLFRTYVTKYLCCDSLIDKNVPLFGKYIRKNTRLATFDAIKANGYKWNAETKTLEKLIEPKFKVGDRIKSKNIHTNYLNDNHIFTITEISRGRYWSNRLAIEYIEKQDNWELVPNKFDISTLKVFDKVLARYNKDSKWCASFFSHIDKEFHSHCYKYVSVAGKSYPKMIPYNGNEHLLGTTDDCDNYYKTWEE